MKIYSHNDIAALRLRSHRFADAGFGTPEQVVQWMGAMQAQDFGAAKWAIGVRLPGATDASVEEAYNRGLILRTHVLRPTWHFVPTADIRWMLALNAPRVIASMRSRDRDLGLDAATFTRANDVVARTLEGGRHLTREELAAALEAGGIRIDTARLYHIMLRAESDTIACSGAMRGSEHTYALLDERTPGVVALPKDEALALLARRYFASHAPATVTDFAWWSGLPAGDVRLGIGAIMGEFETVKAEGQEYLVPREDNGVDFGEKPALLLLPAFDEYIIAYRDRAAVLTEGHHAKAVSSNGVFRPVIVERGLVTGLWKKVAGKRGVRVVPEFFGPTAEATNLPSTERTEALARASAQMAAFYDSITR